MKAAEYLPELRKINEVNTVRILSVMFMACTVNYYVQLELKSFRAENGCGTGDLFSVRG